MLVTCEHQELIGLREEIGVALKGKSKVHLKIPGSSSGMLGGYLAVVNNVSVLQQQILFILSYLYFLISYISYIYLHCQMVMQYMTDIKFIDNQRKVLNHQDLSVINNLPESTQIVESKC